MSSNETFEIFGFDHISTIVLILGLSIIIPYLLKGYSSKDLRLFSIGLAFIIVSNEFGKPFYYPYLYPDLYEFFEMLPFHMCHLSSFSISIFLLTNKKVFFNLAFFWGIGGCSMALTQPDVPYKFPDANFLLYFFSHGLLFFAIMLSTITFKNRPYFIELINVFLGRTNKINRNQHKGFDYDHMIYDIKKFFRIVKIEGRPFGPFLPLFLCFNICIIAKSY